MAFNTVKLQPGLNVEVTPTQNVAGYSQTSLGRYRAGLFEKLGGWAKFFSAALAGVPRCLHAWQDFSDNKRLAAATTTSLGVIEDGIFTDITPQTLTSDFTPDFSTTDASPNVTVDDPNIANVTTLDSVIFNTPISVGGLILSGAYPIDLVLGTTSYRIVAAANATSTVNNGGAVPQFDTTSGESSVLVTLTAHGLSVGSSIVFPISTTGGGVTILGTYTAVTVPSADTFTIAVDTQATSTTTFDMNGGDAEIVYQIAIGPDPASTGYGIGNYGAGAYGTGSSSSSQTGDPITAVDWTLDNWGETLLACPEGGPLYTWTPGGGIQNAQMIGQGPPYNEGMFVSSRSQILVAFGSSVSKDIGVDQDPLTLKWSDQLDYTYWTPGVTNPNTGNASQAGDYRISTGSRIVGALSGPNVDLIWTDLDLWAMNYLGPPFVFGLNKIGSSCGLIAMHARAQLGPAVFWMGRSNFFVMGGDSPRVLPCPVWDAVFQDINTNVDDSTNKPYSWKCWAWANTPFNEVWFFYPRLSTNATECDAFVKYNAVENTWDMGPLSPSGPFQRSCGIDQSLLGNPIAATPQGIVYQHETGYDADGQAIVPFFQTGYWAIGEAEDIAFVDWVIPDAKFNTFGQSATNATLQVTFYSAYYPGDTPQVHGPYTFTNTTKYINTRIRGRLMAMRIESDDLGSFWRVGGVRYRWAQDGRL